MPLSLKNGAFIGDVNKNYMAWVNKQFSHLSPQGKVRLIEKAKNIKQKHQPIKSTKDLNAFFVAFDKQTKGKYFTNGFKELKITKRKDTNGFTYGQGDIWLSPDRMTLVHQAIGNIKKSIPNTYSQEDALATLWHEITHNRHTQKLVPMSEMQRGWVEVANEFVARSTFEGFIKTLGGTLRHKTLLQSRPLTGYNDWVLKYNHLADYLNADKTVLAGTVQQHLFNRPYTVQRKGLLGALNKATGQQFNKKQQKIFDKIIDDNKKTDLNTFKNEVKKHFKE